MDIPVTRQGTIIAELRSSRRATPRPERITTLTTTWPAAVTAGYRAERALARSVQREFHDTSAGSRHRLIPAAILAEFT